MADVSLNTVTKLLLDLGSACEQFHDEHVNNLRMRLLRCDEIWSFAGAKAKNVTPEKKAEAWGDTWTWTAFDADTKLWVSYLVGDRDSRWAIQFMWDCASRIKGRVQVTTDGHRAYLKVVEGAFGMDCDYAMLQRIYGTSSLDEQRHYSPPCSGGTTSRMSMRRFTRPTNAVSKRIQNYAAMVAIHIVHYNFVRIHKTLRITPAMAAGISERIWSLEKIIDMADAELTAENGK